MLLKTALKDTASTFAELVSDPLPDDERDTDVRLEEAAETAFKSKEKDDLYLSVFTRTESLEALVRYVYLSARRHIEAERHHDETTTRGELLIATNQLALLARFDDLPVDTATHYYIRSNYHLVKGMNAASGRWLSTKDYNSREDPQYGQAALEYATAAYQIQEVRPDRALKHMSLAFRHLANQYGHEHASKRLVHAAAIALFIEKTDSGADETDLPQELIQTHEYRKTESEAWIALESGDFETARDSATECETLRESIHLTEITSHTDAIYRLADGREAELDGQYDDAIAHYQMVADTDRAIKRRCRLAEIKQALTQDKYETACELAGNTFDDDHVVTYATRILRGDEVDVQNLSWQTTIELFDTTTATILGDILDMASASGVNLAPAIWSLFRQL